MIMTAVKDLKSEHFLTPQFFRSLTDALRNWEIATNEGESMLTRFPADFAIYKLAEFDPESGEVKPLQKHQRIATALEAKRKPENELPFDKVAKLQSKKKSN